MDINKVLELGNRLNHDLLAQYNLIEIGANNIMEDRGYYISNYCFQFSALNQGSNYWEYTFELFRWSSKHNCLERIVLEPLLTVRNESLIIRNIMNGDDYVIDKFNQIINNDEIRPLLKSILLQEFDNRRIIQYEDFLNLDI